MGNSLNATKLMHHENRVLSRALIVGAVVGAVLATGCATSARAKGSAPIVSVDGRVGPLRVDVSGRASVVAFAGRADAERRGQMDRSRRYDALGYRCTGRAGRDAVPLVRGGPYCRTVFFIDALSGRLGLFYTADSRYVESHGVRVGMPTADAERLLKRRLRGGCEDNIYLSSSQATLTVAFTGGVIHHDGTVTGGRVYALVLHGMRHDPGIFECM
jgi:hypothetical protein